MNLLHVARPNVVRLANPRNTTLAVLGTLGVLMPTGAFAAEGDNVLLHFGGNDTKALWFAFAIGLIAFVAGLFLRSSVLATAAGSAKMQEVGKAIHDGALAYLRKQITTMAYFVVLLAAGLAALFWDSGAQSAITVSLCFCAGVAGSYLSGYSGMLMAVASNMRVANAALTSPKKALEIAFRSGSVAGLITVGIALMGATLILIFGGPHATTLLVGFGFGGSLAALFMRVGGGIFTKAADVGADLVGKVEAGIPEDDPRNPAVIADNVGDNVGDCAGMVADVFESYEVTLISAIVLGAASSAVFDQATWTRLVVFALVTAALGLAASLIGIAFVRGSDDPESSPLDSITRGLWSTAGFAALFTLGASFFLMGGNGEKIQTTQLFSVNSTLMKEVRAIKTLRDQAAIELKKKPDDVQVEELFKSKAGKDFGLQADQPTMQLVGQAFKMDEDAILDTKTLTGAVAITSPTEPAIAKFATTTPQDPNAPPPSGNIFESLGAGFVGTDQDPLVCLQVHITGNAPGKPAAGGQPAQPEQKIDVSVFFGPGRKNFLTKKLDDIIVREKGQVPDMAYKVTNQYTAQLFLNGDGKPIVAVDGDIRTPHEVVAGYQQNDPLFYYPSDAQTLNDSLHSKTTPPIPDKVPIELAFSKHMGVAWWAFFLPLLFGIVMSIALQMLTDYYVSTHRKPTQEVAGVSSAGAAPMIIQGFAYGAESAVFMTLAIVVALIFPLFIFPSDRFGSYILSFYGIALVGLGLLTPTAFVLAMDTFGPISDNAQGVFEMSGEGHLHPDGSKALQKLDAAGNTTKALTKGFAIATAVIASAALFHSFVDAAHLGGKGLRLDVPEIFLGLLLGGAAPYLFSAFTINAVGRASFELIHEVRRQFRSDAGIMKGTSKPNYARCVAIVTSAAQKELLGPGILAIALPTAVAFGFSIGKEPTSINGHLYNLTGAEALGGFLAGAILSGQLMAVLLANSGGMWDNAKKLIEDGMYGGKGSEAHKASVVCDTVGDPFKDTAGPALNPLIKVMNLIALLLAGIVVRPYGTGVLSTITILAVIALIASVVIAKKGSMSDQLKSAANEAHKADEHFIHGDVVHEQPAVETAQPKAPSKKRLIVEEEAPHEQPPEDPISKA